MDDTKLCECLNNEAQIDSIIDGDSDITSEMQLESQVYSDLEKVVEVVDRYEGGTTRDIIVSVDNEADIITATLQKMWFLSVDEFPEVGSDNLIYADKGTGALYTYNSQSGEYEKLIDDTDLRSISINGEKVEIDENKNADIPKATNTQLGVVAVDGAVADDSENPVQNKVIKKYVDGTKTALDTSIAGLDGKIGSTDGKVENLKQTLDATNKNLSDTQNSVNLAHSEIEKTNTRVTILENRATTTETDISNINNSITTINGEIVGINTSLDDKASLTEENSFAGKQNFNGEVEINAVVEANRSVNINNATLNIVDEANDKVTTVYSDRIVSTSGEGGATVEAKLPSKSGTLLTDNDNVAYKDEIPDVSEFITRAVNDLVNYYTKSQIDTTVSGLQAQISAIPKFAISVVTALPTTDISETTIYLLKTSTTETGNLYTEYIYINGSWESLGTQTLDLTGYAKESWVETKIADFLTTSQVNALISSALQEYSKTSEFSDIAFSGNLSDGTQDSTHRLVSDSEKATWNAKQNALTFDEVPTANSDNPVKSKGIKTELDKKANKEDVSTLTAGNNITIEDNVISLKDTLTEVNMVRSTGSVQRLYNSLDYGVLTNGTEVQLILKSPQLFKIQTNATHPIYVDNAGATHDVALLDEVVTSSGDGNIVVNDGAISLNSELGGITKIDNGKDNKSSLSFSTSDTFGETAYLEIPNYAGTSTRKLGLEGSSNRPLFVEGANRHLLPYYDEVVRLSGDQTIAGTKNFSTRPQHNGINLATVDEVQGGILYEGTGDNTDGAMTQKATTEALGDKLTKNMFNTYVGTVDACSDTDGNFGQCANIYNNDGSLYAGRKFTFNKDDFQQDGTDDNKKYSLASDVVRTDDLTTAVSGVETKLTTKVDKVEGKGLSTNDYTTAEKTKLAGLSNYDDTEVKGLISSEAEIRQNAVATLQGEIDSSNENISDLYNVVDKSVVTDATVAETTSQANITLTKTNISSGATSAKTVSIPSATGSQAGLLSAEAQTIGGAKTFTGDVTIGGNLNVSGTDIDTYIKNKAPSFTYDADTKTLTITT